MAEEKAGFDQVEANVVLHQILPEYEGEIKSFLQGRRNWDRAANIFDALGHVLQVLATIFAFFAAVGLKATWSASTSAILGVAVPAILRFALYADRRSSNSTHQVNILLKALNSTLVVPDISSQPPDGTNLEDNDTLSRVNVIPRRNGNQI